MDGHAVDELIRRLLDGKKGKAPGKKVQLSEAEIRHLCVTAKGIFLSQPNLLELEAPINVCGESSRRSPPHLTCWTEFGCLQPAQQATALPAGLQRWEKLSMLPNAPAIARWS